MEITGKVIALLEQQKFVSQKNGNEYVKTTFVVETQGNYPKKIAFTVMGDDRFKQMGIVVGGTYNVSFDVESREWQGKWFTDVSAWKAVRVDGVDVAPSPQPQSSATPQVAPAAQESKDDLPF